MSCELSSYELRTNGDQLSAIQRQRGDGVARRDVCGSGNYLRRMATPTKTEAPVKADFSTEMAEWIEAFDEVVAEEWQNGAELLKALRQRAREAGVTTPSEMATPFCNTIPKCDDVPYPGDRNLERRIKALIRWNAMAMVHGQNRSEERRVG